MPERFDLARLPQARVLTPEEAEARAATCFELDGRVRARVRKGREALWELAEALYEFDEESGWSPLGFDSVSVWLAQPDIDLSPRTYQRMVATWRELVVLRQVDPPSMAHIDLSKADIVLPAVKSGRVQLTTALVDARTLSQKDLRAAYRADDATPNGHGSEPAPVSVGASKPSVRPESLDPPAEIETAAEVIPTDTEVIPVPTDQYVFTPSPPTVLTLEEAIEAARDPEVITHGHRGTLICALRDVIAAYDREVGM